MASAAARKMPHPPSSSSAPSSPPSATGTHVDIDALIEEYAWRYFQDMAGIKKTGMESFKNLAREEAEFVIDRKRLVLLHGNPEYHNMQHTGTQPSTLFKSVFTNKTSQTQNYSLKAERTSESICGVSREHGFTFGIEAELTLKTPCEIAELKTGFKHELRFNKLTENIKTESLTWAVDNNIQVPAGGQTEASVVIEEMSYRGSYSVVSTLTGLVTVSIRRIKDGALVMPLSVNVVTILSQFLTRGDPRLKGGLVSIDRNCVLLNSKGTCHFQSAVKQYVELTEIQQHKDYSAEMNRLALGGYADSKRYI